MGSEGLTEHPGSLFTFPVWGGERRFGGCYLDDWLLMRCGREGVSSRCPVPLPNTLRVGYRATWGLGSDATGLYLKGIYENVVTAVTHISEHFSLSLLLLFIYLSLIQNR